MAPSLQSALRGIRHPSDDLPGPRVGLLAIELTNGHAKPFVWTKTADQILDSVARFCHRISNSGH
jgi:hypothetical protein